MKPKLQKLPQIQRIRRLCIMSNLSNDPETENPGISVTFVCLRIDSLHKVVCTIS